jgi:hypothetical protein
VSTRSLITAAGGACLSLSPVVASDVAATERPLAQKATKTTYVIQLMHQSFVAHPSSVVAAVVMLAL